MRTTPLLLTCLVALAGCASGSRQSADSQPLDASASRDGQSLLGLPRWTGNFQPQTQRNGSLGPAQNIKAFGTVTIAQLPTAADRVRVQIQLTAPVQNSSLYLWAVHPGRCGSGTIPVMAIDRFPALEVQGDGRGTLNTELQLSLATGNSYHLNVYFGRGSDISDVLACALLREGTGGR